MPFLKLQKSVVFILALISVMPQILSFELSKFSIILFGSLYLAGFILPGKINLDKFKNIEIAAVLALFAYEVLSLVLKAHIAGTALEFAFLLLGLKLFFKTSSEDYRQIVLLSFLMMISGTVTGFDISYGAFFIMFTATAPVALWLSYVLGETEFRFYKDPAAKNRLAQSKRIVGIKRIGVSLLMVVPLIILTAVIFISIPRIGAGFGGDGLFINSLKGFSESVKIGELNGNRNDSKVYIRLFLQNGKELNKKSFDKLNNLKFRGGVFDVYKNSSWNMSNSLKHFVFNLNKTDDGYYLKSPVKKEFHFKIIQEPLNPQYVFYPENSFIIKPASFLKRGRKRDVPLKANRAAVLNFKKYKSAAISYDAYTGNSYGIAGSDSFNNYYLNVPVSYKRLKDLANKWTESITGDRQKIQVILRKLNSEYSYAYTLTADEKKKLETGDDPINNFLFKTKKGTCEHFATAITLMARSVGIKSRFVTGFMGVKYNSFGKYYTVTASMAHAWSEVLINGSFVTVDATPPLRGGGNVKKQRDFFRMFKDTLELRWHMYIMDFDEAVQFEIKTAVFNELKKIIYYLLLPVILFFLIIISFVLIKKRGWNFKKTSRVYGLFNRVILKKRPSKYGYMLYKKLENRLRIINSDFPSRAKNCTPLEYINSFSLTGKQSDLAKEIVNLYYAERFGNENIILSDYKKYKSQIKNSYT